VNLHRPFASVNPHRSPAHARVRYPAAPPHPTPPEPPPPIPIRIPAAANCATSARPGLPPVAPYDTAPRRTMGPRRRRPRPWPWRAWQNPGRSGSACGRSCARARWSRGPRRARDGSRWGAEAEGEGESSGQRRRLQHSGADMGTISSWVFATRRHADALLPRSTLVQPPPPMPRGGGMPAAVMPRSALLTRAEAVTSTTETPVHQITIRCTLPYAKCLRWVFVGPFARSSSARLPVTNTTRCALQPSSVH
jgi:hypothetical protein